MRRFWTNDEIESVREAYRNPNGFDLAPLAAALGRTHAAVACKAEDIGITTRRGKQTRSAQCLENNSAAQKIVSSRPGVVQRRALIVKAHHAQNGHPRGFLGGHHTTAARLAISNGNTGRVRPAEEVAKSIRTRLANFGTLCPNIRRGSWKAEWVEIGGHRFFARSSWEKIYAEHLEALKARGAITEWRHEPRWFEFLIGGRLTCYVPDFMVEIPGGRIEAHEVKGWMDARSKVKLSAFQKHHPEIPLIVLRAKWFKDHANKRLALGLKSSDLPPPKEKVPF